MTHYNWWPIAILALTLAAGISIVANLALPIRAPIVFAFLLLAPGMSFVKLLPVRGIAAELTLAIALSLALDTLVSEAMVVAGTWSPGVAFEVLDFLSVAGAVVQIVGSGLSQRGELEP